MDEHSLHSPFLFDFYTKVIKGKSAPKKIELFAQLRQKLLQHTMTIEVNDLGSGVKEEKSTSPRLVKDIAATSLSPLKYSLLYNRIIKYFKCKTIIELGTSLGINTLYLAEAPDARVTTFEGAAAIAELARTTFEFANAHNIALIEGAIETTLPSRVPELPKFDFAFIDANHRYQPTIQYFEWLLPKVQTKSIMVFDDIHRSKEMSNAWNELQKHPMVYLSADLYRCGILFFDPSLTKQAIVLQF